MNGRVYDPVLARFLSPDPFVQAPDFTQSFNRYAYCWNNPFKYHDPDGELIYISLGVGWSKEGGLSISLGVGIGFKNNLSAGISIDYNFGSNSIGFNGNVSYMGTYATAGWNSNAGWNTGGGYSYGVTFGIFNVSVFSAGVSYSQHGGFSANVGAINYNQHSGASLNPSIGVGVSKSWDPGAKKAMAAAMQNEHERRTAELLARLRELMPEHSMPEWVPPRFGQNELPEIWVIGTAPTRNGFDIDEAVNTLNLNARDNSVGRCARYVRMALESGGIDTTGRPVSAKDYSPHLARWGFQEITTTDYLAGDIVVMQGHRNSTHGHIQMYNGTQWVSDFRQSGFWPGAGYRDHRPSYRVFRW